MPYGYDPKAFGADGITRKPDGDGYHYTAWRKDGGQVSWNADAAGNYRPYSASGNWAPKIHGSDANIPGRGTKIW